jgi:hypothetical protein
LEKSIRSRTGSAAASRGTMSSERNEAILQGLMLRVLSRSPESGSKEIPCSKDWGVSAIL